MHIPHYAETTGTTGTAMSTTITTSVDTTTTATSDITSTPDSMLETNKESCPYGIKTIVISCTITAIITALLATVIFGLLQIAVCKHFRSKRKAYVEKEKTTIAGQSYTPEQGDHKTEELIPMKESATETRGDEYAKIEKYKGRPAVTCEGETQHGETKGVLREQEDTLVKGNEPTTESREVNSQKDVSVMNLAEPRAAEARSNDKVVGGGVAQISGGERDSYIKMESVSVVALQDQAGPNAHGYAKVRDGGVARIAEGGERDSYVQMDSNKGVSVVSLAQKAGPDTHGYDKVHKHDGTSEIAAALEREGYMRMGRQQGSLCCQPCRKGKTTRYDGV